MAERLSESKDEAEHALFGIYECNSCGYYMEVSSELVSIYNDSEDLAKLVLDSIDAGDNNIHLDEYVELDIPVTIPCDGCEEDIEVTIHVRGVPIFSGRINERCASKIEIVDDVAIMDVLLQMHQPETRTNVKNSDECKDEAEHALFGIYECNSCGYYMEVSSELVSIYNNSEDLAKLVLDSIDAGDTNINLDEYVELDIPVTIPCDGCEEDIEVTVHVRGIPIFSGRKERCASNIEIVDDVAIMDVLLQMHQPETRTNVKNSDETNVEVLTILVKTRMPHGYCCLGIDSAGNVKRPVYRQELSWDWSQELLIDKPYEFTLTRSNFNTCLPHSNEDIAVEPYPTCHYTLLNFDAYDALSQLANESIESMFGGHARDSKYVVEGTDCPSFGVLSANGCDIYAYINENKKHRVKIGDKYDLPYTGHDFYGLQLYDPEALVVLGLSRPFDGKHQEYCPKRCCIIALRIVQRE